MSIVETDWGAFLAPDSDIRPDVIFRVEGASDEGQTHVKNIAAHRIFLAGVSPVFMGMFYGPLKETQEIVDVKDISLEAFENMIKFIYNPREGTMFNLEEVNCPQKLFEILAVADKYQINRLPTLVMSALENLVIGRGNMIFAATTAKNNKHAFDELSTKVLLKCLKFFLDTKGGLDVCALIQETFDNFPGASLDILRELFDVGKEALQIPGTSKLDAHLLPDLKFLNFLGWRGLVFFDPEEHPIRRRTLHPDLAPRIPDGRREWKIILEIKLKKHTHFGDTEGCILAVVPGFAGYARVEVHLRSTSIDLVQEVTRSVLCSSSKVPKVGIWTRIEVSQEKEDGRYFFALSVEGNRVGREETLRNGLLRLSDASIDLFPAGNFCGDFRRLVVLNY